MGVDFCLSIGDFSDYLDIECATKTKVGGIGVKNDNANESDVGFPVDDDNEDEDEDEGGKDDPFEG